jgi:hypothetical protein
VFEAIPNKKAGLQRVKIWTEVSRAERVSADNVWVPVAATAEGREGKGVRFGMNREAGDLNAPPRQKHPPVPRTALPKK